MDVHEIVGGIILIATGIGGLALLLLWAMGPPKTVMPTRASYMNVERQSLMNGVIQDIDGSLQQARAMQTFLSKSQPAPRCRWCKAEMRAYETTCKVCGGSR